VQKFRREIVERGAHVILFANAAIVDAFALSRPAKVEAQYWDAALVQRFGRLIHDFIVHGAAEKRVRVADYGCERRIGDGHGPEQSLEASGGTGEEEVTMEDIGHERCGYECNEEFATEQNRGTVRQAFLGISQRTSTLVSIALTPSRGLESGAALDGVRQSSMRTMRAGISPARAQSPQGIFARTASPVE
jgi:hypothetical protein